MKIRDVIQRKAIHEVITIRPDATVRDLLALLAEHNIGAVIVSQDGSSVDGMASERDIVRRLREDEDVLGRPVEQIMTAIVHTCEGDHDVDALMSQMTEHRVRHVPVLDQDRLVGVVSIGDVVASRINQLEYERDQLDSYVRQS